MVEPIMFFGIGFLFAALIGLIIIPLVQARAVRLTMRRLEAATPLSMAEIQADKDQLRAEFAMSTRRLEMSVEQMKAKTTSQLAELGKKSDAINRLKMELGEKTATIFALEARDKALKDQLRATEEELSFKLNAMREAERALAEKQEDLARLTGKLDQQSVVNDSQRVELVALRTQVDALKDHVNDTEREFKTTEDRLDRERFDAAEASDLLNAERSKVGNLADRVSDLEHQLIAQTKEAEILGRRAQELETRLSRSSKAAGGARLSMQRAEEPARGHAHDRGGSARPARRHRRQPALRNRKPEGGKGRARASSSTARGRAGRAAPRNGEHEARYRGVMGFRARGERALARAHQRCRGGSRPADRGAGRPGLADRNHFGRGGAERVDWRGANRPEYRGRRRG